MSLLTEAIENQPHWLYLICSGNDDNTYKIGYTSRPVETRLNEIKMEYTVPNAKLVKQCEVKGESNVLMLEQSLHDEYYECQDSTYGGCEWFCLEPNELNQIKLFYDNNH